MELTQAIKQRRSVRKFSGEKISEEAVREIIEAGTWAPSHCNTQGWKFIIIDDQNIKQRIFEAGAAPIVKEAPLGILVLYNTATSDNLEYRDYIQSASAAMQNMLLKIEDLGFGGCWVCHLPRKKTLSRILGVKEPYEPVAYLALGQKQNIPFFEMPRKNKTEDLYSFNNFAWPAQKTPFSIKIKRMARKIYFLLPSFAKKALHPLVDKFIKKFSN